MVLHYYFKGDKQLHQSLSKYPVGFTMYNDVHVGHQLEINFYYF